MPVLSIRNFNHYYQWITTHTDLLPTGKPVLVFLHGWGGSARYWERTAHALSDHFDCLLYDLRGFGRSQQTSVTQSNSSRRSTAELIQLFDLETYADDLAQLLKMLAISKVSINAHSTGASIATLFLNRYPQFVDRAILTCSGIFEYNEAAFKAFYQFGEYVVRFRPLWLSRIPFANRIFMARFLHRALPDAESQAFLEDFLLADYEAALGTIFTAVSKKATEEMPQEFAQIPVPTLLIAGQYDKIIPATMGQQAAALNPNIHFIEMSRTAHFPMLEDATAYLEHVRNFLQIV
jgi:pimeloyl-ACP methyl ester carboxylesterase